MNDEKWIVSDKDHLGGKPRVQGTRISVAFLLECLASGMSMAEIVDTYPTLTENAVQGALRELAHEKEAAAARGFSSTKTCRASSDLCDTLIRSKEQLPMSQMITISLPDETRTALNDAASEEGLSENALVEKALSDYLFIRRFRNLRERLMSEGNDLTDQNVFDLVS